MKKLFRGRILPILTVMCIIAVTAAIAVPSVSADNGDRLNNWQGYIITELLINGSDRSNPLENGDYLTLSETELYVGDSIRTNG